MKLNNLIVALISLVLFTNHVQTPSNKVVAILVAALIKPSLSDSGSSAPRINTRRSTELVLFSNECSGLGKSIDDACCSGNSTTTALISCIEAIRNSVKIPTPLSRAAIIASRQKKLERLARNTQRQRNNRQRKIK